MSWKYCVMRKMKPNSAKKAMVTEPLAAEKAGTLNRVTSSIGSAVCRSTTTNAVPSRAVPANPAILDAAPQPRSGASMMV